MTARSLGVASFLSIISFNVLAGDVTLWIDRVPVDKAPTEHVVDENELRKVDPWEPEPGSPPPLDRDRALASAVRAATADGQGVDKSTDATVTLRTVNRWEKDLVRRFPKDACRWFYLVSFRGSGKAPYFHYTVTMSGTVARKRQEGD